MPERRGYEIGTTVLKGTWNATTNAPALADGAVGYNPGDYYIVSVAGNTPLDGISDWNPGDWVLCVGGAWSKVDNTDQVVSVAGKQGVVTLDTTDLTDVDPAAKADNKILVYKTGSGKHEYEPKPLSAECEYAVSEGVSATSAITYQQKLTKSYAAPVHQNYLIIYSAEIACSQDKKGVSVKLEVDDTLVGGEIQHVNGSAEGEDEYISFAGAYIANLDVNTHTIDIDWKVSDVAHIARIRRARIVIRGL